MKERASTLQGMCEEEEAGRRQAGFVRATTAPMRAEHDVNGFSVGSTDDIPVANRWIRSPERSSSAPQESIASQTLTC
jgi:hypothetical protein